MLFRMHKEKLLVIIELSVCVLLTIGEIEGNNLTFLVKPSNLSSSSRYEGEHSFRRYSPSDADGKGPDCRRAAQCQHLNYTTCMGVKLPYSSTTLDLVDSSRTQDRIQEMCKMAMAACRILESDNYWPSFIRCDDPERFRSKCKNDVLELRFNTTGQCLSPLVPTDNTQAFYEGVEGCGVQCQNPLLTEDEHNQIHQLVAWGGTICLLFNLFTVVWKIQERIDKKSAYFHMIAWSLPLVLTITTMALGEIDGDSVAGICFVGYMNHAARAGFLLGPLTAVLFVGGYFLSRGYCQVMNSARADPIKCKMDARPSLSMLQLHILVMFLAGVVMSSWVWTSSTIDTWRRRVRRALNSQVEEPVRLKKHKVIAQAFAKRKTFNNAGRMSLSLNFDINSVASQDFSSTWAAALPKLMTRRGALIGVATGSNSSQHRNSVDSEISYSVRRVSVESRRHSLDSQVSVQIAEVTATRKAAATPIPTTATASTSGVRGRKTRVRRHRREYNRVRKCRVGPIARRGSDSSQESQLGAQILSALTLANSNIAAFVPNLKQRRAANAGLDSSQVILPFNLPGQSMDLSDEDPTLGIAKKFNMILQGQVNDIELEDCNQSEEEVSDVSGEENEEKEAIPLPRDLSSQNSKKKNKSPDIKEISRIENKSLEESRRDSGIEAGTQSKSAEGERCQSRIGETNKGGKLEYGDYRNRNIPDEVKLYLTEDSDEELPRRLSYLPPVDIAGLSDGSTSFCPELSHLAVHSSYSGLSVGTQNNFGGGKINFISVAPHNPNLVERANSREIGTQTSQSDYIEMEDLSNPNNGSPIPRACTSQSTQVSPRMPSRSSAPPKPERLFDKGQSPHSDKFINNVSQHSARRGLNYSYNAQRLIQEMTEINHLGPPVRPERRKSAQGKDIVRSKSAEDRLKEGERKALAL
ncbi:hypothetical protein C0J52_01651 [Blattella germanica]|nr:hypothetical protein C0J52_01651 [Blattella germanica]